MEQATTFIGLDVHKAAIAVAIADGGCRHAARYLGEIPNTPEALSRLVRKLGARGSASASATGPARAATASTAGSGHSAMTASSSRHR